MRDFPSVDHTLTQTRKKTMEKPIEDGEPQSLFVIRHGDRWDYAHPEWKETALRRYDPPLSALGHQQARETGLFLDQLLSKEGITAERVTWLSSPYLRTLQTSDGAIQAFSKLDSDQIRVCPEDGVSEYDSHNLQMHHDLPTDRSERLHYFPRLDLNYQSTLVPTMPENKTAFLDRCDRSIRALSRRFPYSPRTAIVVVTHAATCIGLARAGAGKTLADINCAGPCGIFRLTRTNDETPWSIDAHNDPNGFNGYMGHLSDRGIHTIPWNHFGDKSINKGYTGPPIQQEQQEE